MTIRSSIVALLPALLLAIGFVPQAAAQSRAVSGPASSTLTWTEDFGQQVRVLLETGDEERQGGAMQLTQLYAGQFNADIDFSPAVPALLKIYETSENEGLRLMALASLDAIGNESALNRLAERVLAEKSERVRKQTLRVLTSHLQHGRQDAGR